MTLLEKYNTQREAIAKYKSDIAEYAQKIREAEQIISQIKSDAVEIEDLIAEKLEQDGISNYYFFTTYDGYKGVAIDGILHKSSIDFVTGQITMFHL